MKIYFEFSKKSFFIIQQMLFKMNNLLKKRCLKLNKIQNVFIPNHIAGLTKESIYKTDKEIIEFLKYYEKN